MNEPGSQTNVHISSHPLAAHKLALLRDRSTEPIRFRQLVTELAAMVTHEATRDLELTEKRVATPLAPTTGHRLADRIGFAPILRAGLGMVEGARMLVPQAQVWHLGIRRDEESLAPVEYYNRLSQVPSVTLCLILDPMLATGGSAIAAVSLVKKWGVERIKFVGILAAPEGIAALHDRHPEVGIHVCAVDARLTDERDAVPSGFIWPGLGDAGDRQFDTVEPPDAAAPERGPGRVETDSSLGRNR